PGFRIAQGPGRPAKAAQRRTQRRDDAAHQRGGMTVPDYIVSKDMNAPLEKSLIDTLRAPHFPIYMDYSATTPVDPRVADKMIPYLREQFGNPASRSHMYGWTAEQAIEEARGHVAALVNADPREIIWTSGATESNNLALKGAAQF